MSTRSQIAMEMPDKTIRSVYCHSDGYLEGVGMTLMEFYRDPAKVEQLIALGGISSLGAEIGKKHPFDQRGGNVVTAYHRDRGEELEIAVNVDRDEFTDQFSKNIGSEYLYLFRDGTWYMYSRHDDTPMWGKIETILKAKPLK